MAEYKRIPLEFVENTEIARKSYLDYLSHQDEANEKELEADCIASLRKLNAALKILTLRQREVYILIIGHQLKESEVAKLLNISQQAVSERLLRAKARLMLFR